MRERSSFASECHGSVSSSDCGRSLLNRTALKRRYAVWRTHTRVTRERTTPNPLFARGIRRTLWLEDRLPFRQSPFAT